MIPQKRIRQERNGSKSNSYDLQVHFQWRILLR